MGTERRVGPDEVVKAESRNAESVRSARAPRDVAVIGAGPAGLAAAWTLVEAGARVTVYEERSEAGGRMRTDRWGPVRVDPLVQLFGSYFTETFRLADEVGAGGRLIRSPGRDALWRDGRVHGIAYGSMASMAASTALPTRLKLRLGVRYVPFLRRHATSLDAADPLGAGGHHLDFESIAQWGERELGDDFVNLLAYPLLAAYYGATPEGTSAAYYHALAAAGMDVQVYAVRDGVGALAQAVAGALEARDVELRYGTTVTGVDAVSSAKTVEVGWDGGGERHEAAVLAVPPGAVLAVAALRPAARAWLEAVRTCPMASLAVLLDRPARGSYFGVAIPRSERAGERLAAICMQERKQAELVPADNGLAVMFPSPGMVPRIMESSANEALDLLLPALDEVVPGAAERVVQARLYRFSTGGALFYPGYLHHLRRYDAAVFPDRLALAGDYLVAPTVEGAIRSGRRAARRLLNLGWGRRAARRPVAD